MELLIVLGIIAQWLIIYSAVLSAVRQAGKDQKKVTP